MTTFDVDDLATRLPEVLAEVEAGRDVVLARGATPVAKVEKWRTAPSEDNGGVAAELRANRKNFQPVTLDEIVTWKNEDRR